MIQGRVVDGDGVGVADARVLANVARTEGPYEHLDVVMTDGDGAFTIPLPFDPVECLLEVRAAGLADNNHFLTRVDLPVVVVMHAGASLAFVARDPAGLPVEGLWASLFREDRGGDRYSEAGGRVDFGRVMLGEYHLLAYLPGYEFVDRSVVVAGDQVLELQLEHAHRRSVRFRLTGATVEQLANMQCKVTPLRAKMSYEVPGMSGKPDAQGLFELHGLPADSILNLSVRGPGLAAYPSVQTLLPHPHQGMLEIPFTLRERPTRQVRGRVVDESGQGLGGLSGVSWWSTGGEENASEFVTDDQGRFVVMTRACDGELLRMVLLSETHVFDSPTSVDYWQQSRRRSHSTCMPCDVEITITARLRLATDAP